MNDREKNKGKLCGRVGAVGGGGNGGRWEQLGDSTRQNKAKKIRE